MTQAELGEKLNAATTENLLATLKSVPSTNNLFVPSKNLSPLLNYLTPFLALKKTGNFEKVLWLEALTNSEDVDSIVETYSLIVLIRAHPEDLELLVRLWNRVKYNTELTIIVKDLKLSFHYEILSHMSKSGLSLLEKVTSFDENVTTFTISSLCTLANWKSYPTCIHDFVFSLDLENGGLLLYFNNPLSQISQLSHAVADVLKYTTTQREIFKLKNAFAKGDHSSLLMGNLLNDKIPEMLSELLSEPERTFYDAKLRGNADLVVLERNLDYFPILLSQTNYMGFLDDIIGTKDEFNSELRDNVKLDDETYEGLKHINVSSIETVLRDLARKLIADENQLKERNAGKTDASDLKEYANEAKLLASKKEEVEKHLDLVRETFAKLDANRSGTEQYDIKKEWLALQNELFDSDYKHRLASIYTFLDKYTSFEMIATLIVLVSLTSDGLYQSDYDKLELDIVLNFGLGAGLALRRLAELKLIRTTESNSFLGNFTFGRTETTTTSTASASTTLNDSSDELGFDDVANLALTGGQNVYKSTYTLISKFWNLHPFDENERVAKSVSDYAVPNFALASNTVPLTNRVVESLYFRDFLTYTPVNNVRRRPNWEKLNLDTMLKGQTVDRNLCDDLDDRKSNSSLATYKQEYVIVVLIGGISRAEISVFQHLQNRLGNKKLLVFTSGLVNNEKLMQALKQA